MEKTNEYYCFEIGYNGCDVTDIKAQIPVAPSDAKWLAEIIYSGLEKHDYAGRFVNIVGKDGNYISVNQSSRKHAIEDLVLPTPITRRKI